MDIGFAFGFPTKTTLFRGSQPHVAKPAPGIKLLGIGKVMYLYPHVCFCGFVFLNQFRPYRPRWPRVGAVGDLEPLLEIDSGWTTESRWGLKTVVGRVHLLKGFYFCKIVICLLLKNNCPLVGVVKKSIREIVQIVCPGGGGGKKRRTMMVTTWSQRTLGAQKARRLNSYFGRMANHSVEGHGDSRKPLLHRCCWETFLPFLLIVV